MCKCWQSKVFLVQEGGCEVGETAVLGHVPAVDTTLSFMGPAQVSAEQLCQDVVLPTVHRWYLHG